MEFGEFIESTKKFARDSDKIRVVQAKGIKPVLKPEKGYIIALRFSPEVEEVVKTLAGKIAQTAPAIAFQEVYTPIAAITDKNEAYSVQNIEQSLAELIGSGTTREIKSLDAPGLLFRSWLCNQKQVVAIADPTRSFFEIFTGMEYRALRQKNILLSTPKAVYVQAARFTEERTSEQLKDFLALIKTTPSIGQTLKTPSTEQTHGSTIITPTFIEAARYELSPEGFKYERLAREELRVK